MSLLQKQVLYIIKGMLGNNRSLIGAGSILLIGSGVRFYRVIRTHAEDYFFAPHLLLASLSLLISWTIIKAGLSHDEITRRGAISLIRSGSLLMMIWGYRLYLLLTSAARPLSGTRIIEEGDLGISYGVAVLNVVLGTLVMCIGLKTSRAIRKGQEGGPTPAKGSNGS